MTIKEIEFYKNLINEVKNEVFDLELQVNDLKRETKKISKKTILYGDVFKQKPLCTPDMDVFLDLTTKEKLNREKH